MGYFSKVLAETVDAINRCYEKNVMNVNVGRIRKCSNVKSTDRSKIVFISRALDELSRVGFIDYQSRNSPKNYQIKSKIKWEDVLKEVEKARE